MEPSFDIIDREQLASFCRRWKIVELSLFGSALGDNFGPESDIDLLVSFAADAGWGLFAVARMQQEIEQMFGRRVDIVTRRGIEASRNAIRRESILSSARSIYVAR